VHPVRFAAAAGSLPSLDCSPAGFAVLPGGVGEVIFPRMLVAFAGVGIRKSSALAPDKALLGCISGGHLYSLPGPDTESQRGVTTSSMA
jgi:hypothetical protein